MEYQLRNWQYFSWLCRAILTSSSMYTAWTRLPGLCTTNRPREPGASAAVCAAIPNREMSTITTPWCTNTPTARRSMLIAAKWPVAQTTFPTSFIGTKGTAYLFNKPRIEGENPWQYEGPAPASQMYDREHEALFHAIRANEPVNNGEYMARSTMWALLGRMVDYTGQVIAWEDAMQSQQDFSLPHYAFDITPPVLPDANGNYDIPRPGTAKLI